MTFRTQVGSNKWVSTWCHSVTSPNPVFNIGIIFPNIKTRLHWFKNSVCEDFTILRHASAFPFQFHSLTDNSLISRTMRPSSRWWYRPGHGAAPAAGDQGALGLPDEMGPPPAHNHVHQRRGPAADTGGTCLPGDARKGLLCDTCSCPWEVFAWWGTGTILYFLEIRFNPLAVRSGVPFHQI